MTWVIPAVTSLPGRMAVWYLEITLVYHGIRGERETYWSKYTTFRKAAVLLVGVPLAGVLLVGVPLAGVLLAGALLVGVLIVAVSPPHAMASPAMARPPRIFLIICIMKVMQFDEGYTIIESNMVVLS